MNYHTEDFRELDFYKQALEHAKQEGSRESCGLGVVINGRLRYMPCNNLAENEDHFIIDPECYAYAEDKGEILYIVHSHPNEPATPSEADLIGVENTKLKWLIINPNTGEYTINKPKGYKVPLIGRKFYPGVLDCYALIRDYYKEILNVELPDYPREDKWWVHDKNLYIDNYNDAGFIKVGDLKEHDVIVMYSMSEVPNHAAVYLGDECMLHHIQGRLSSKDIYGGYWVKNTWGYLRHKSLL